MLVANDEFYESIDNSQQDEYDIVLKASKGDKIALEYIIKKYKNFVKAKANIKRLETLMQVKQILLKDLLIFV